MFSFVCFWLCKIYINRSIFPETAFVDKAISIIISTFCYRGVCNACLIRDWSRVQIRLIFCQLCRIIDPSRVYYITLYFILYTLFYVSAGSTECIPEQRAIFVWATLSGLRVWRTEFFSSCQNGRYSICIREFIWSYYVYFYHVLRLQNFTVRSETFCEFLVLSRVDFDACFRLHPAYTIQMMDVATQHLQSFRRVSRNVVCNLLLMKQNPLCKMAKLNGMFTNTPGQDCYSLAKEYYY